MRRPASTLFVTHCCGNKNTVGSPLELYISDRIQRFGKTCSHARVPWAIVSAEHALFFPHEQHQSYDTEMMFSGGQICVLRNGQPLASPENRVHIRHLTHATADRCSRLGIDRIVFYVGGAPQRIPSYLLLVHTAIDGCAEQHRLPKDVIICIETSGRLKIASGMFQLERELRRAAD